MKVRMKVNLQPTGGRQVLSYRRCMTSNITLITVLLSVSVLCAWWLHVLSLSLTGFRIVHDVESTNHREKTSHYNREGHMIILVGPAKTASTSIQKNLNDWSPMQDSSSPRIGSNWLWVRPNMTCLSRSSSKSCTNWKLKSWTCFMNCHDSLTNKFNNSDPGCPTVFRCFQDTLRAHILSGNNNIVFGTELLAWKIMVQNELADSIIQFPIDLIRTTLSSVPSSRSFGLLSWVVTYRAPRIDHLISSWHQERDGKFSKVREYFNNTPFSLRSYLKSPYVSLARLDSLRIAVKLANHPYSNYDSFMNVNVVILDMSGVARVSKDISMVVACEIVSQNPCRDDEYNMIRSSIENKKDDRGLNDLTSHEILKIEGILKRIDCNSVHEIRNNPRIHLMHSYLLEDTLSECQPNSSFYSHEEAIEDIRRIFS